MLVLSRFVGETIIIGGDVKITVISRKGNGVKFGIDAPDGTKILREELYQKAGNKVKEDSYEK